MQFNQRKNDSELPFDSAEAPADCPERSLGESGAHLTAATRESDRDIIVPDLPSHAPATSAVGLSQDALFLRARIRTLETQLSQTESRCVALEAELNAVKKAALSEKIVAKEYVDGLRDQVAEVPTLREAKRRLVAQTEELISSVRAESAQIAALIDTVQTSKFWRLKYGLNRLRAALFRR